MNPHQASASGAPDGTPRRAEGERVGQYRIIRHLGAGNMGDVYLARWLLNVGADVDARSQTTDQASRGWSPLYHTMVSLRVPRAQTDLADLLLVRGADPTVRAHIAKPVAGEGVATTWEGYRDVTPLEYARHFREPALVNHAAVSRVAATTPTGPANP